jgi:hypothetical protein
VARAMPPPSNIFFLANLNLPVRPVLINIVQTRSQHTS